MDLLTSPPSRIYCYQFFLPFKNCQPSFVAFRFMLVRQPAKRIRNLSQPKDGLDFLKQPTQKYFAETDNKTRGRRIDLELNYFLFHAFSERMELLFRVFFYCARSFDGLFLLHQLNHSFTRAP